MDAFIQNNCELFDYLILDEAQDLMNEKYLEVFDLILSGGLKRGKWLLFMDADNQNLYSQNSYQNIQALLSKYDTYYTKYLLKDNCRNSIAIIELVDKWFGFNTRHRNVREKGVDVVVKPYRHDEQEQEILTETLTDLLEKFAPSDIVLLSPKRFENSIASKINAISISDTKKSDTIYFSTIQSFKGLESKIVVLCDISDVDTPQAKQYLYVGMTRAKSALYIVMIKRALNQLAKE
jgi:superfamily I DNA/RNA helicase